jgi:hypothetical protein
MHKRPYVRTYFNFCSGVRTYSPALDLVQNDDSGRHEDSNSTENVKDLGHISENMKNRKRN